MPSRIVHRRYGGVAQPRGISDIDFSHPLARGLQMFLVPTSRGVVDLVNPDQIWTPAGAATVKPAETDFAAVFNGSAGTQYSSTGYANVVGVGTMFLWARVIGVEDTNGHVYLTDGSGVYYLSAYGFAPSSQKFYIGTAVTGSWPVSPFSRKDSSLVFVGKGTSVFQDGILAATPAGSDGTAFSAGSKTLYFGRYTSADDWNVSGEIVALGWTTQEWTQREAASWHANPWQFVRRRTVIPRSSAAPAPAARPYFFFMT